MVDIQVEGSYDANFLGRHHQCGPIYTDGDTGYVIYGNSGADLVYQKTADGGATWGGQVAIKTENIVRFSCWFDKHTPSDSGTLIHMAYIGSTADDVFYRTLDTSDDSLGTERQVFDGASALFGNLTEGGIDICKAVGGNLYIQFWMDTSGERGFYRSTNAGVAWTARTDGADGDAVDQIMLLPDDDSADNEDMVMIYWDVSANALTIKKYDDSGNSWGETAIASGFTESTTRRQFDAMVRHSDGHIIVVAHEAFDSAASDYKCYDITLATPTVTAKTDIITATDDVANGCVFIDQSTDDLYALYVGQDDGLQTLALAVDCHYKKSDDGAATWGSETTYSVDAADDLRQIWSGRSTPGNASGRFGPMFQNDDLDDLFVNVTNSIEITVGAAADQEPSLVGGKLVTNSVLMRHLVH